MTGATVKHFLVALTGRLTRFDQKMMEKGRGHNPYALGHYLETVDNLEAKLARYLTRDDPEAMEALRQALLKEFTHSGGKFYLPPVNQIVKMIDQWLEAGKLPKYGTSLHSQASLLSRILPKRTKDTEFYADFDKESGYWCVFGEPSGVCYDTFTSRQEAIFAVREKNRKMRRAASLRSQVIKLAHRNPELRPYLLPLLK